MTQPVKLTTPKHLEKYLNKKVDKKEVGDEFNLKVNYLMMQVLPKMMDDIENISSTPHEAVGIMASLAYSISASAATTARTHVSLKEGKKVQDILAADLKALDLTNVPEEEVIDTEAYEAMKEVIKRAMNATTSEDVVPTDEEIEEAQKALDNKEEGDSKWKM